MSEVVRMGGGVFPSAQLTFDDSKVGENQSFMLGIIISVQPSDDKDNMVAKSDQHNRGSHHECTVLAGPDLYFPDIFLQHVIIPPMKHSGMDNYEEDLPRGCTQLIDGSSWNPNLVGIDYGKLDGEWCLAPDTKILTSDLTWVPIKSLKIGQELIGFNEKINWNTKLCSSVVQATKRLLKQCVEIHTTTGKIVCSNDHLWVVREPGKVRKWKRSDELTKDDLMCKFIEPWQVENSYEAGYLAGFLDAEGSIGRSESNRCGIQFGQNPGLTRDWVVKLLEDRGFTLSTTKNNSQFGSECLISRITGNRAALRILGSLRPIRLSENARIQWEGSRTYGKRTKPSQVLRIRDVGMQVVYGVQTSSRTFIAEGFLSHNCILGFLNGSQQFPFIVAWWPHPSNTLDVATTGNAYSKKSLTQVDPINNKFRSIRVINGVTVLVNGDGSVYLDTTQGGRKTLIKNGKQEITKFGKGGHIQVDIKRSSQLEFNFNVKAEMGPRLGAGSTKALPVFDPSLPHPDQPVVGATPQARETKRTYRRSNEWEILEKTSVYNVFCENTEIDNGKKGIALVKAEDTISITVCKGTDKSTMIDISKGIIQVCSNDGTQVNVLNDEVQIITKSGGMINVKGSNITLAGKVNVSGPMAVGGTTGQPLIKGTTFNTIFGTTYLGAESALATAAGIAYAALSAVSVGPLAGFKPGFDALKAAWVAFKSVGITPTVAALPTALTVNTTSS